MLKSRIVVSTEQEGPRTMLKESYYNAPYKVVHYGSPLFHSHLELIIMSSSPGVLDGDELDMAVHVRENCRLRLFTQSFNKLHPMREGARQQVEVHLGEGSVFQYIPHPVTPFRDSVYKTVNTIRMAPGATLKVQVEQVSGTSMPKLLIGTYSRTRLNGTPPRYCSRPVKNTITDATGGLMYLRYATGAATPGKVKVKFLSGHQYVPFTCRAEPRMPTGSGTSIR